MSKNMIFSYGTILGILLFSGMFTHAYAEDIEEILAEMNTIANDLKYYEDGQQLSEKLDTKSLGNIDDVYHTTKIQEYIENNSKLNRLLEIKPDRNYVEEWKQYKIEISKLVNQINQHKKDIHKIYEDRANIPIDSIRYVTLSENAKIIEDDISQSKKKISELKLKADKIEQDSIKSMKLESQLEEKLVIIEKNIYQEYLNFKSSYIGDNPVDIVYVDRIQKKVIVQINPEFGETKNKSLPLSSVLLSHDLLNKHTSDLLRIEFSVPKPLTCTAQDTECRPLVVGIGIWRENNPNDDNVAGTIGFMAKDNGDNEGFVTAAHVIDNNYPEDPNIDKVMLQPKNGDSIGRVTHDDHICWFDGYEDTTEEGRGCDFAFVTLENNITMKNEIFQSQFNTYQVTSIVTDNSAESEPGTLVLVGTTSGIMYGQIIQPGEDLQKYIIDAPVQSGDSGGPVFKASYNSDTEEYEAKIFGIILKSINDDSRVTADYSEKIMTELNLEQIPPPSNSVPSWIKDVAKFWHASSIQDWRYLAALEWLIDNRIIIVAKT